MFPNLLAEMAANGQITQKALAEELGLTESTMGAKLAGRTDFKYSEMKKLKKKLLHFKILLMKWLLYLILQQKKIRKKLFKAISLDQLIQILNMYLMMLKH